MTALLDMLAAARRAGLVLTRRDDQLVIRGPREHEQLVRALLDRKPDVLAVLAVYNGEVPRLDWRREPLLADYKPCALCRRSTLLVEPFDGRPCHKTCAEAVIRWGTVPAAKATGGRAA
jgi:hypothetical protein